MKSKLVFGALILIVLLFVGYRLSKSNYAEPRESDTYIDAQYGFELQYPSNWILDKNKNQLSFITRDGYVAYMNVVPNTNPGVPDHKQEIKIGIENGTENSWEGCEQGNPCYAIFEFKSPSTISRGFEFQIMISNLKKEDVDTKTFYPYPRFESDIQPFEKALSTLIYTK